MIVLFLDEIEAADSALATYATRSAISSGSIMGCSNDVERSLRKNSASISSGSSSISVIQGQHSCPHQFWAGATVHCSLQHLETVDLPFGLTVAPREFDRIFDGITIPAQNAGEPHNRREFGVKGIVDPFIQASEFLLRKMPLKRMAKSRIVANTFEPCIHRITDLGQSRRDYPMFENADNRTIFIDFDCSANIYNLH